MGNCATFTNELYAEIRTCDPDPDTDRPSRGRVHPQRLGPEPYPNQYTFTDYNAEPQLKECNSFEESVLKEDPYSKYLKQEQQKSVLNEFEEKVLDFKMLSVRNSINSVLSDSFTKNKTKEDVAEMTIIEDNKEIKTKKLMMTPNVLDRNAEPMQPMNRDKMGNSFLNATQHSKTRKGGNEEKNILDNSSMFLSPFKKPDQNISSYQNFRETVQQKPLNNVFFIKTLHYLGPFDYTIKEDFLVKNPLFRDFLQSVKNLPLESPKKLDNGATYTGQWKKGQKNGTGKQIWPDGSFYEGYWYQNQAHGKGRLIHSQGTVYDGYWAFDQAHGQGLYFTIEGSFYQGNWYEDKQHGFGIEKWGSGASYEGDYFMGMKHGKGLFRWEDGSYFQGDFQENLIQGKGKYHWNDGRDYDGEWSGNKMNGKGVFKWSDGRIYSGNYENDEKNGIGVFFWPDGSLYKGFWMNGMQHGKGKFIGRDGSVKEGNWRNGVLEE